MKPILETEGLGKRYRLGSLGAASLRDELAGRWARWRGGEAGGNDSRRRDFWALRDVSLAVQRGEVLGIVGRNGAGKSTLLKILSRITEPTEGRALLRGRVASLLEVGTGFHPELSGRENIYLNGAILGMKRAEIRAKFDRIVDFSGVGNFLDTPVKRYSSGMYVRLAFAVAAHLEPDLLVVDEVLAVGDADFQKKCLGKMEEVSRQEGRTVLFVSHNLGMIRNLCRRVLWIDGGRLRADDLAENVIRSYCGLELADSLHVWNEPESGADGPRMTSVRIFQDDAGPGQPFRSSQPIRISMELAGLGQFADRVSLEISNVEGRLIIHAGDEYAGVAVTGRTRREAVIAAGALGAGVYRVGLYLYGQNLPVLHRLEGVLSFTVFLDDCRTSHEIWKGAVSPALVRWI